MRRLLAACTAAVVLSGVGAVLPAAAAGPTINVAGTSFSPGTMTVAVGNTVTWNFTGGTHSVTSDDGTTFDSDPTCSSGNPAGCRSSGSFTFTFSAAGTYAYHCRFHGNGMAGTVVVDGTPPNAASALVATPGSRKVTLSWTNPTSDFGSVIVRSAPGTTPPGTQHDGRWLYTGTGHTTVAPGFTNGQTYAFAVFARDAVGNYATSFPTATATPSASITSLTAAKSASIIKLGQSVRIFGYLRVRGTSVGVSGERLELFARRRDASAWGFVKATTSTSSGSYLFQHSPTAGIYYQVRHAATASALGSSSPLLGVSVRVLIGGAVSSGAVERLSSVTVGGQVIPAHTGQIVALERFSGGAWHWAADKALNDKGTVFFTYVPQVNGNYTFRLHKRNDTDHVGAVTGPLRFTVYDRALSRGMSGDDVRLVQERLSALSYDPGAPNGEFGYDTQHAVFAFQKVNGLPTDGVVGQAVRARLAAPVAPRMRFPRSGYSIEIDKTRQILMYALNGVVQRALDVSTGSGRYYYQDGYRYQAITPEGAFHIYRKINGMRKSKLGELWRPAYFYQGFAIHGNSSVPTTPASHGCVRITNDAMNRMYDRLYLGTPVYVYH